MDILHVLLASFVFNFCEANGLEDKQDNEKSMSVEDFTYMGSYLNPDTSKGRAMGEFVYPKNYYVSRTPASHRKAKQACTNVFGPKSHLINIETRREWRAIRRFLQSFGNGILYWTGGDYDGTKYIWYSTGKKVGDFAWGKGEPKLSSGDPTKRVTLYFPNQFKASLITGPRDSALQRYICEIVEDN